ncbi:hypothetical protein HU200_053333 [Digitaria exilis]|uniref:Uncharacterized protein n=1 Tax=Digitaria exilis TaxID=1010633 RepID=A0A835ASE8_9POAL|nr:hypothetical protein HU200_053333 [Digitaria exilis]
MARFKRKEEGRGALDDNGKAPRRKSSCSGRRLQSPAGAPAPPSMRRAIDLGSTPPSMVSPAPTPAPHFPLPPSATIACMDWSSLFLFLGVAGLARVSASVRATDRSRLVDKTSEPVLFFLLARPVFTEKILLEEIVVEVELHDVACPGAAPHAVPLAALSRPVGSLVMPALKESSASLSAAMQRPLNVSAAPETDEAAPVGPRTKSSRHMAAARLNQDRSINRTPTPKASASASASAESHFDAAAMES